MCDGGLQMTDIECQINASKIKWISRLLDVNNAGVYYSIVKDWFKPFGAYLLFLNSIVKVMMYTQFLMLIIPPFYKDILKVWYH